MRGFSRHGLRHRPARRAPCCACGPWSRCGRSAPARAGSPWRVLDVGAGAGILALTAARYEQAAVLAIDLDPEAVAAALENVPLEQFMNQVWGRGSG